MKDSITFGLPSREQNMGGEVSGSRGQPVLSMMGGSKVYMPMGEDARKEKK